MERDMKFTLWIWPRCSPQVYRSFISRFNTSRWWNCHHYSLAWHQQHSNSGVGSEILNAPPRPTSSTRPFSLRALTSPAAAVRKGPWFRFWEAYICFYWSKLCSAIVIQNISWFCDYGWIPRHVIEFQPVPHPTKFLCQQIRLKNTSIK